MAPGSMQFTPRQLLDAGRRAEAEGKLDLAQQFYGHLSDHYGHTAEASEGRRGLARVGASGPQPQVWGNGGTAATQGLARRRGNREGHLGRGRGYLVGRVLAVLLSALGWLTIAGALMVLAVAGVTELAQVQVPQGLRLDFATPIQAVGALAAGAGALLVGEAARALFDQANAARELVALERGRHGTAENRG
jgi:hypothetical protein